MVVNLNFQNITTEQLVEGYQLNQFGYQCLFCDSRFHVDEVFPWQNKFLTAEGMMKKHILEKHQSPFHAIMQLDKKTTGLSDVQMEMLQYFYERLPDKEITDKSSVTSVSTVRQHRFKLREKERQAKILLALMQLINEPNTYDVHSGAKQVDERYSIEKAEREKVLKTYFKDGLDGEIERIPSKEKKKLIILQHIIKRFDAEKKYTEKEVNEILKTVNPDFVSLRRHLIEYGLMNRNTDNSSYWVKV